MKAYFILMPSFGYEDILNTVPPPTPTPFKKWWQIKVSKWSIDKKNILYYFSHQDMGYDLGVDFGNHNPQSCIFLSFNGILAIIQ